MSELENVWNEKLLDRNGVEKGAIIVNIHKVLSTVAMDIISLMAFGYFVFTSRI